MSKKMHSNLATIYSMSPNLQKGCTEVAFIIDIPFLRVFKKFNVYKKKSYDIRNFAIGDNVLIRYERDAYPRLINIEKTENIESCSTCRAYFSKLGEMGDDCGMCYISGQKQRSYFEGDFELLGYDEKMRTYGVGITLTFHDPSADVTLKTVVFENHPLFSSVKDIKPKSFYNVKGWIVDNDEDRDFVFFDLTCEPKFVQKIIVTEEKDEETVKKDTKKTKRVNPKKRARSTSSLLIENVSKESGIPSEGAKSSSAKENEEEIITTMVEDRENKTVKFEASEANE